MTALLAFAAAVLLVPAVWEAVAVAGAGALPPLRRALRSDAAPGPRDARRLLVVVAAAAGTAGAVLAGPFGAVAGAASGPFAVRAGVALRDARRRRAVLAAAAPVARAVADALAGGASTRRALLDAAGEGAVPGPAGAELRRLAAGLHAGEALEPALRAWRDRLADPAHATIAAALLLHQHTGGGLAEVLREQADALEEARRTEAEAAGATVQARTAARIVAAIPLLGTAGAVVLAPDAARGVVATPVGALLVAAAAGLLLVAVLLVGRLTRARG